MSLNETASTELNKLSEKLLKGLIPGYSYFSKLFKILGLDLLQIVQACMVSLTVIACVLLIYRQGFCNQVLDLFTSSVQITSDETIFDSVLSLLFNKSLLLNTRSLIAISIQDDSEDFSNESSMISTTGCLNFAKLNVQRRLRLEPGEQYIWFRCKGHWYRF